MNGRQAYALAHPLDRAAPDALRPLTRDVKHQTGLMIRTILAVDR